MTSTSSFTAAADFLKAGTVVRVKFRDAIVIGNEKIRVTTTAQVRGSRCKRPATAIDAEFFADLFKTTLAQIAEQIFSTSVLGVFETLRHDFCRGHMPQVHIFRVITADEQVEQAIAVEVEPHCRVGVDPRR